MQRARAALLVVVLGGAILAGSYALDLTTPDATYEYEVQKLSTGEDAPIVQVTLYVDGPPGGILLREDAPEREPILAAQNGTYTFPADSDRLSWLVEYEYYVVEVEEDEFAPYRVRTTRSGDEVRMTAERISTTAFYDALAVPAEQVDPQVRENLGAGRFETDGYIEPRIVRDGGRYYLVEPEGRQPYHDPRVTLYESGYGVGALLLVVGGLWWLYERGKRAKPHGGQYS